jgi:hypothetical protein
MTPRATSRRRWCRSLVLGALAVTVALTGCGVPNPDAASSPSTASTPTPTTTALTPSPAPTRAQVNRQDHPSPGQVRSQQAASSARPMLPALPITANGVTIDIGGLAPDGRTTILTLTTRLGRAHALAAYRHELRRYGDTGRAYQPVVKP